MAERSGELDEITERNRGEETPDEIGTEIGASTNYCTTALGAYPNADADNADENRSLSPVAADYEQDVPTTGDTTDVVTESDDPEEIRAQIEQTRNEMSETINAIQEKLSFDRIAGQVREEVQEQISSAVESAKHAVYDATVKKAGGFMQKIGKGLNDMSEEFLGGSLQESGTQAVSVIRQNPIPFALIGVGVGLLLFSNYRSSSSNGKTNSYRYSEDFDPENFDYSSGSMPNNKRSTAKVGDVANKAYSAVSGTATQAYDTVSGAANTAYQGVTGAASTAYKGVSNVAGTAYNQVGNIGSKARQAASWTQETYSQQLEQNPFAVGAVAFAIGAVIGLSLPSTEIEGQYMGEARENLLQKAQEAAGGMIEKVQQVAGEVTRTVQDEVKSQGTAA